MAHAAEPASNSPNERPGVLLIGHGLMGGNDAKFAQAFGDIVAICDVDTERANKGAADFKAEGIYSDFRKAMEHKGVDVVLNVTPDHWHTLINIHALRAGKDVYSEKPLTLTIDEGKNLIREVRKSGRILQTGSQQRSNYTAFRLACDLVRNGRIGKLERIITQLPAGLIEGPFQPEPPPAKLNWDFWQGPTGPTSYVAKRAHMYFRFWYDYSGGTLTDWGAHHNDIAQWANGSELGGPTSVQARVLQQPVPGGYTAIGRYEIEYEYANGVKLTCRTIDSENFFSNPTREITNYVEERNGVRFVGSDGWIFVNRQKLLASDPELISEELPSGAVRLPAPAMHGPEGKNSHMGNFFDCVKSQKEPMCPVEVGHRSASLCHLGAIALRTGRKLRWDPASEVFENDADANAYLYREMRKPWSYEAV